MARVKIRSLPDDSEPLSDIFRRKEKAFKRKQKRADAERWLPVHLPEHQGRAVGLMFFGDMHIDDDGCNVPLLRRDLRLCAKTSGMYGLHLGDMTNNWVGFLSRLHGEQSVTQKDARRLAQYVMCESGVDWVANIVGNHDAWNEGAAILGLIGASLYVAEWEAKLVVHVGRAKLRIHVAHDFPGNSMWNITHGPARAARMASNAELLVCGHKHDWGIQSYELAGQGRVVHAARARGYKWFDHYATTHGFQQSEHGACITAIFNPRAKTAAGRVMLFSDPEIGAAVLKALRKD